MMAASTFLTIGVLIAFYLLAFIKLKHKKIAPLPPGPRGLPIVGNIRDLPPPNSLEFLHWVKHKEIYGPISSVTVLGQTIVIINDRKMAIELLEKRAAINSGRPMLKFAYDMVGWKYATGIVQHTAAHRLARKYANLLLGSKGNISKYHPHQEAASAQFLWRIKQNKGQNIVNDLKLLNGGLILKVLYNYNTEPHKPDPLISFADLTMEQFSDAFVPGKWMVDMFPVLAYLPEWLPGADFKRTARLYNESLTKTVNTPSDFVKYQRAQGDAGHSYISGTIDQAEHANGGSALSQDQEHSIKWSAMSLYVAGEDTSAITMSAFFLAMSLHPEVQRRAQADIDRVVGRTRLPTHNDRASLPYLNAIVEEALRYHPIGVFAIPHAADKESFINGYRIPQGAVLLPNVWHFTRDTDYYHDPETFKPERFLEPYNEPSATDVVFGFGRRICSGRRLVDSSLYLVFAQTLAAFNIEPRRNQSGEKIQNTHNFEPGLIARASPFEVSITPRSNEHGAMVERLLDKFPWNKTDAPHIENILKHQ